jgi:nitroimidazol reductase NimA-like FMN-containing flavoprotein (pyridoxamine 5'-phosphate oxidase superfamily)
MDTLNTVVMSHNLVHIATVDGDGNPAVRGVDYAAEEGAGCIYIMTRADSNKVAHMRANPAVSFAIDHDCPSWEMLQDLKYIKGSGTAVIVEDMEETQKAVGLLMEKFPFLVNLPGEPTDFVAVRIDFGNVEVTDNTVSFAHTEVVEF